MSDERPTPSEFGTTDDAPPIEEKPYKIIFEANKCFGAGRCAEASTNWELDLETGVANPRTYFLEESELNENVRAAELCPAKKGDGVIHIVDRKRDVEIAPDPHGDGSLSVDW
ncbi:ferredoxin [Halohasta salina]|uniref:ferredoxin n=1 Tax=Halohasta salina TaxID=2961621 RepID=UPI0020A29874|nr:ferredoxin [Halohasta salina]